MVGVRLRRNNAPCGRRFEECGHGRNGGNVAFDPNVWSGRALQESLTLAVSGLASMYPAFDWSVVLLAIMGISARAISLADRP